LQSPFFSIEIPPPSIDGTLKTPPAEHRRSTPTTGL